MAINNTHLAKSLLFSWCLVALWTLALIRPATAAPLYNIVPLGFDDPAHTHEYGFRHSEAYELNEAGQVIGSSQRLRGNYDDLGYSAWLYDGATTINIGFTGPEYTRDDGYKFSGARQLNEAGQVTGHSDRYADGGFYPSRIAWLYDGTTTIPVGLTGPEHTKNDGYKESEAKQLNEVGQVVGNSKRYNSGSTQLGYSAWLYNGTTTIDIGLTGNEYTRSDGYKYSFAHQLNDTGQVIGTSERYNGVTGFGLSAWLYDGSNTIEIGLTGAEYTQIGGFKYSFPTALNDAGQVSGSSSRFNGSAELGSRAWLYNGATTIEIGLTGPEYTRNDGYKSSGVALLNEAGQVVGASARYNGGGALLGHSAWLYDGATTVAIGLTDIEHTRSDGYKGSDRYQLNEAGQVTGISNRYNGGSTQLGYSAWLYNGATTIKVGLTSGEYTLESGLQESAPQRLNKTGQVIGYSSRYIDNHYSGQSAWFYDPTLNQTFPLVLSTSSDGYAFSYAYYLGEDGLVLGKYHLYDDQDNHLGERAFSFTIEDGMHDLGSLIEGGLTASDWDFLASAIRANGRGQIIGHGAHSSQSIRQLPYLLTPAIPEPSSLLLAGLAATLMAAVLIHRKRL